MFSVVTVSCPLCGNEADVTVHYTRRAVFGSCEACGTLGTGVQNGLIEHRRWVDIPDWSCPLPCTDEHMCPLTD